MDDAYRERLTTLAELARSSDLMSARSAEAVGQVLELMLAIRDPLGELGDFASPQAQTLRNKWEEALYELPGIITSRPADAFDWTRSVLGRAREFLRDVILNSPSNSEHRHLAEALLNRVDSELDRVAIIRALEESAQQASDLLSELQVSADAAKTATGSIGGASLADYFEAYAREQKRSADRYRHATLFLIGAAALLSILVPHPSAGDWIALAYRISGLLAVIGLSAYCGRQSSQHRRLADWAKSLQVQLLSLPAFLDPITDEEARSRIYDAFARRVLGPPPTSASDGDEAAVSTAQLIDLISAVVRKA